MRQSRIKVNELILYGVTEGQKSAADIQQEPIFWLHLASSVTHELHILFHARSNSFIMGRRHDDSSFKSILQRSGRTP